MIKKVYIKINGMWVARSINCCIAAGTFYVGSKKDRYSLEESEIITFKDLLGTIYKDTTSTVQIIEEWSPEPYEQDRPFLQIYY